MTSDGWTYRRIQISVSVSLTLSLALALGADTQDLTAILPRAREMRTRTGMYTLGGALAERGCYLITVEVTCTVTVANLLLVLANAFGFMTYSPSSRLVPPPPLHSRHHPYILEHSWAEHPLLRTSFLTPLDWPHRRCTSSSGSSHQGRARQTTLSIRTLTLEWWNVDGETGEAHSGWKTYRQRRREDRNDGNWTTAMEELECTNFSASANGWRRIRRLQSDQKGMSHGTCRSTTRDGSWYKRSRGTKWDRGTPQIRGGGGRDLEDPVQLVSGGRAPRILEGAAVEVMVDLDDGVTAGAVAGDTVEEAGALPAIGAGTELEQR
ncbi:hypothetical protein DFH09DRAFT_1075916 [Mycena vulgaris]|nr:hypothetical protein DFH09DRAFT_1075916 [Mycena vulgaris]